MTITMKTAVLGTMIALSLPIAAQAQQWGGNPERHDEDRRDRPQYGQDNWWAQHRGYVRALADIRTAYWLVSHVEPNNPMVGGDEQGAQRELHAAYDELTRASISDGVNIDAQPADMVWGSHGDRLHQAYELVHRAALELEGEEDNPQALGLRQRARGHMSESSRFLGAAMRDSHLR